jgi:hypothetical protein
MSSKLPEHHHSCRAVLHAGPRLYPLAHIFFRRAELFAEPYLVEDKLEAELSTTVVRQLAMTAASLITHIAKNAVLGAVQFRS